MLLAGGEDPQVPQLRRHLWPSTTHPVYATSSAARRQPAVEIHVVAVATLTYSDAAKPWALGATQSRMIIECGRPLRTLLAAAAPQAVKNVLQRGAGCNQRVQSRLAAAWQTASR